MSITLDQLAADIRQRIDAIHSEVEGTVESHVRAALSDREIENIIRTSLPNVLDGLSREDSDLGRKIRGWGGRGDANLIGSKYRGLTVGDVEMLHDITQAAFASRMSKGPSEELTRAFAAVSQGRYEDTALVRSRDEQRLNEMFAAKQLDAAGFSRAMAALDQSYDSPRRGVSFTRDGIKTYTRANDAMDTAESGYGSQLIGAQYVHELWRGAEAQSRVFGLINRFDMTDPTAYLPVQATLPIVRYVGESTASNASWYTSSSVGSNRVQVDAKKLNMLMFWSYELEEDSLIPFLPFIRAEAERSWGHHMDGIILNGDTTNAGTGNINSDDADPDDTSYYLAFDGVRHAALVDNTGNSKDVAGPLTIDVFRAQLGRMVDATYKHDWSHPSDPDELVYIADPETADAVSFLDECLTVDKIGDRATALTGQQGRLLNHPVVASIDVPKTEADGKVSATPANNTKGQLVALNKRGFVVGTRSQMQVETDREIRTQQNVISFTTRIGLGRFTPTGAASGIESVDVLYDIAL